LVISIFRCLHSVLFPLYFSNSSMFLFLTLLPCLLHFVFVDLF
jgi:hypothetical protein